MAIHGLRYLNELCAGLLKEYRKLDDSINMRMNRTSAQFRDRDRAGTTKKGENLDDQACLYVWKELTGALFLYTRTSIFSTWSSDNWKRREDLINYCVNIMDQPTPPTSSGGSPGADATQRRLAEAESYSAEVKKSQIKRELTVEGIIRRRSWEGNTCRNTNMFNTLLKLVYV